jgi:PAS domain S-box-containing protein
MNVMRACRYPSADGTKTMTTLELIRLFAHDHPVACAVSDVAPYPGPYLLYVNPAFERMSGYPLEALAGRSPRMLQGRQTERSLAARLRAAVVARRHVRTVLTNYRPDGSTYLCEVAIHPLPGPDGEPLHFLAFEREMLRRRGRPAAATSRFIPAEPVQAGFDRLFGADWHLEEAAAE